jgi:hypothetical protein
LGAVVGFGGAGDGCTFTGAWPLVSTAGGSILVTVVVAPVAALLATP